MQNFTALLRRYALGVWRKRWTAVLVAWVVCATGWGVTYAIPNSYEANARLYVDADAVLTPLLKGVALDSTPANQLEMLQRTLLSRPNLDKVIEKTDLELTVGTAAERDALVAKLAGEIHVVPDHKNLFTIAYRNSKPKLVFSVVQTVLNLFIENRSGTNRAAMDNASRFINAQISQMQAKLSDADARRAAFRSKYLDVLPDSNGGPSRLQTARGEVLAMQQAMEQAQVKLELARAQLAKVPPKVQDDNAQVIINGLGGDPALSKPCADLQTALATLTDKNPTVLNRECDAARKASGPGRGQAPQRMKENPEFVRLQQQVYELQAEIATAKLNLASKVTERDRLEGIFRGAPGLMAQYDDMNRGHDVLEKAYYELLQRRQAMELSAAADVTGDKVSMRIVDPPQVPTVPVFPNRVLFLSLALALGIGAGAGIALLLAQFDTSFHNVDDLRRLELPVLGAISLVAAQLPLRQRLLPLTGLAAAIVLLGAVFGGLLVKAIHAVGAA
jgi:polysaccharide chain length determinant protein (PEP-CTERM system associated)